MEEKLQNYYDEVWGSRISVSSVMYDSNDTVTTNFTEMNKTSYTVTVRKLLGTPSTTAITVAKQTTKATITVAAPTTEAGTVSTPPITGKYRIKCIAPNGATSYSNVIDAEHDAWNIEWRIKHKCDGLYEKIDVWQVQANNGYRENGWTMRLRFTGLNGDPGQFTIESYTDGG